MFKIKRLFIASMVVISLLLIGCEKEQTPVNPDFSSSQTELPRLSVPVGATIDSAMLFINVTETDSEQVTVHRVTDSWEEMTVTWNNFSGSYDPTVEGTFTPFSMGWYSVNLTGLVSNWLDEIYPNYGLLLKETSPDTTQIYSSKEGNDSPYLIIWWTLNDLSGYDSTGAFADSYIQSDSGDINFGDAMELLTGWQDTVETQTLIAFEIELVYTGCTRSKGYWKTHSAYGPAPYDSAWALLGEDSTFFLSNQSNYEVMWTNPSGGNAYYMLAHQYIATSINILNGADPSEIQSAFDDATNMFETYTPEYIGSLRGNDQIRQDFISLKSMLAMYNEGEIGPGHCQIVADRVH
jgi:hypothetical protein